MSSSPTGSSSAAAPLPSGARAVLWAALLAALLFLPLLSARHLLSPDEPRDAEIAREFADGGWSVVPRLNGEPYWSKPPLFTGSAGLLMKVTGSREEWVPKAAAALHGIAAVAATAALAELLLGAGTGILAGLLLAGIPYALLRFRTCTTDAGLAAWMTVAMLLIVLAERRGSLPLALSAGLAAGAAMFAKAAHGIVFPFLAAGIWIALDSNRRAGWWLRLLAGLLVGGAVYAAWVWILGRHDGEAAVDAFVHGNWEKRTGDSPHHEGGPFHYLNLLHRVLPWTFAAAAGAWAVFRPAGAERPRLLLPLVWVASMVAALSLATGKRDLYLLPVLPAVALLAAGGVDAAARGALSPWPDRLARWPVEALSLPFRAIPWFRADLRRRACGAALVVAAGTLAFEVLHLGPASEIESGRAAALESARAAAGRPLVLFRMGQGDVGQFAFPLDRTLPVAVDEDALRRIAAGREVVVVAEAGVPESAAKNGRLSADLLARWTLLGERRAGETWRWYAWDGR